MPHCSDCRGSGRYVGLNVVEPCAACGGSGQQQQLARDARPGRGITPLAEAVAEYQRLQADYMRQFGGHLAVPPLILNTPDRSAPPARPDAP